MERDEGVRLAIYSPVSIVSYFANWRNVVRDDDAKGSLHTQKRPAPLLEKADKKADTGGNGALSFCCSYYHTVDNDALTRL